MDLSQCVQQQLQNQQRQCLTQLLDLANNYAAILTNTDFPLSIAPPNIIHEYLCHKSTEVESPSSEKQSVDAPMNLCIRDQKPKSAFVGVNSRTCDKSNGFAPKVWSIPRLPLGCEVPPLPLKMKEALFGMHPTRRRAGWKGVSVCAACFKTFNKMSELNQHYMQRHKDLLEREWTAALSKRQRRCCKTANQRRLFPDQSEEGGLYSTTSQGLSQTQTGSCGRLLDEKTDKGIRKGHICPWCKYCAKWPTELQKHIVVHANLRPFACIICNNCYKWSWDLGRHFSTVHAGLPNPYKMSKKSLRAQLQRNADCDTVIA